MNAWTIDWVPNWLHPSDGCLLSSPPTISHNPRHLRTRPDAEVWISPEREKKTTNDKIMEWLKKSKAEWIQRKVEIGKKKMFPWKCGRKMHFSFFFFHSVFNFYHLFIFDWFMPWCKMKMLIPFFFSFSFFLFSFSFPHFLRFVFFFFVLFPLFLSCHYFPMGIENFMTVKEKGRKNRWTDAQETRLCSLTLFVMSMSPSIRSKRYFETSRWFFSTPRWKGVDSNYKTKKKRKEKKKKKWRMRRKSSELNVSQKSE